MNYRELAKFLSGLITGDFIVGLWFYAAGESPINFFGMRIPANLVLLWMLIDVVIFILLVRFAWFSKSAKKKK